LCENKVKGGKMKKELCVMEEKTKREICVENERKLRQKRE